MKRELAFAMEAQSLLPEPLGRTRGSTSQISNEIPVMTDPDSNGSAAVDHSRAPQGRFRIYTRNKRLKSATEKSDGKTLVLADSGTEFGGDQPVGIVEIKSETEENVGMEPSSVLGGVEGAGAALVNMSEMVEVEVTEEPLAVDVKSSGKPRRFTRSALKATDDDTDVATGDSEGFKDAVIVEVDGAANGSVSVLGKLEMKMSKKIEIKGRPTTVKELFGTGLLEGYPVFYNGGKKGIPLRGTIKDDGILCSCSLCKGIRVVPPCQFEIHACRTYRRASQYICLENGKSLLDVVKECRKSSVKDLEETIQSFIGPLPVKESIVCQNCQSLFLATSAAKMDQLCDSCMIFIKSKDSVMHTPYARSRASEPVLRLTSSEIVEVQTTPLTKRRGRKKRKFSEMISRKNSSHKSLDISPRKRSQWKMTKLSKPTVVQKSAGSSSVGNSLTKQTQENTLKSSASHTSLKSSKGASSCVSPQSKSQLKITKKDQKMHRLVFEDGGLPDGTELAYFSRGQKLLSGYKRGLGIFCSCCSTEVSPSQFEAHAGWASRKKPYGYIYMSNGVSLHEFAISLLKGRKPTAKENDDLCTICADGGKLVLCDGCPRAFHKECASLSSIPRGKWYCKYCENMFQRERFVERNANAVAAGRVPGIVDPIGEVTNRCIRIVKSPEDAEVIACVICRAYDFSKSGFGPRTVILCDQCEKEYHVGCLKKTKMADLKELPKGKWFCSGECKKIYLALNNLLNSGSEKLPESSLEPIREKLAKEGSDAEADIDVSWRILSGKATSRETRLLLSEAVAIFHDCFDPIVDSATGRDFIPSMVYGRNIRGQDFSGMYCAILTVNSQLVSAAILRIFGQDIAELPLVATRVGYQGKGYFQLLFSCIEKLLAFLKIRTFVLPAADEAESIWTNRFGFKKIPPDQLIDYKRNCWQMINFKGTSMLEKMVPKCRIIRQDEANSSVQLQ